MQELEKVLEEIEQYRKAASNGGDFNVSAAYEKSMSIIREHMPDEDTDVPANGGWIPVEERLPEELAPVLVTACVPVRKPGWDKRKEFCVVVDTDVYDPEIKHGWEYFKDKVTAWMPLPEPYHGEEVQDEKE